MSWADDTITAFGDHAGIPGLAVKDGQTLTLSFERDGVLCIERQDKDMLLYLLCDQDLSRVSSLLKALELCHPDHHALGGGIGAGICRDTHLVFITRCTLDQFTLPMMEKMLSALMRFQQSVLG